MAGADRWQTTARWPTPRPCSTVARAEGTAREVEDELFRFARTLEGTDELRETLTDPHIPATPAPADRRGPPRRQGQPTTVALVSHGGRHRPGPRPAGHHRPAGASMSAAEANKEVAEVRSAVALTDDQSDRLAEALGKATGKQVEVKVIVDPR